MKSFNICLVLSLIIINISFAEETKKITCIGRVIDYNARPVADAEVVCYQLQYKLGQYNLSRGPYSPCDHECIGNTRTSSDGRFSIQGQKELFSPSYLVAGKPGLAIGWKNNDSAGENIIRLGKPSQFKGIIVDEAGDPVPDARVRICLKKDMMMQYQEITPLVTEDWFTTRTDAKGQFLFNNIPEGATADFGVEAPGKALIWTTCDSGLGHGEQFTAGCADIRIVLPPEAHIQGRVVKQETGEPLAGVQLMVRPISHANRQNYQDQIYSDSNGKFVITGLAPGKHLLQTMSDKQGSTNITVTVEPGQTVNDVKVFLAGCPLEVIVYDTEKGNPIENAYVTVTQEHTETKYTSYSQLKATNANGLAMFYTPPGECEVKLFKFGHGVTFQPQKVQLEPGQTLRHEVSMSRMAYTISGEVLDEQGRAVSGASVMGDSYGPRALTDVNGQFNSNDTPCFISRLPSRTKVLIRHVQSATAAFGTLRDSTRSGRLKGQIILKPAYELRGHVTDPNGRSVPAAYVKLQQSRYRTVFTEVATDSNGVYSIRSVPLPDGNEPKYVIAVRAGGFGQTIVKHIPFHDNTAQPVHIELIVLLPANQVISGVVQDSNDQPVAGALVSAFGPRFSSTVSQPPCGKTLTDAQGRFRITGVCKEPLRIYAKSSSDQQQSGQTWAYGGNENVRVVLGQKLIFSPSLIGKPLPDLKDLKVDLSPADTNDKMMLVCFFDMEQRPSRNCLRQLSKKAQELKAKDIVVAAVQASKIDEDKLSEWVKKNNIPFPVGMIESDEEKIRFAWGVRSLPWLILTDYKNIVRAEGFSLTELDEKISAITQR